MSEGYGVIASVRKDRLPKGYGYALQTSKLETLLREGGYGIHTELGYFWSRESNLLLQVRYWIPKPIIPYEKLYILAGAMPSGELRAARAALEEAVFPRLAAWVEAILAEPEESTIRSEDREFSAVLADGVAWIRDSLV